MRSGSADRFSGCLAFVGAKIVQDDDVTFGQGWDQNFRHIGCEEIAVDGSVETHGASMRSWRKAAMKVSVFQCPCGTRASSRCPRGPQPRKGPIPAFAGTSVGLDPCLVDEDEAPGINPALMFLPAGPFPGDIRT